MTENRNEFAVTFSSGRDLTNLMKSNARNRRIIISEDAKALAREVDDMEVSFRKQDGSIDWQALEDYKNGINSSEYRKSMSSVYRAKNTIYDLIQSNFWEYFVTITVNPNSEYMADCDIKNPKAVQKKVMSLIDNMNRRRDQKIAYVFIPEYQQNGNVHLHGVISGVTPSDLEIAINNQEYRKDKNGIPVIDKDGNPVKNEYYQKPLVRNGNQVYNHKVFNKVGYNDFEIIRDMSRVGSYCTKYITKDLLERSNEYGAHLYLCSKGLERKKEVYKREVEKYETITDEKIHEALGSDAYIIRNEFNTKIIINKRNVANREDLFRFLDSIQSESEVHSGIRYQGKELARDYQILAMMNQAQLKAVGIEKYDEDTGEVILSKVKKKTAAFGEQLRL